MLKKVAFTMYNVSDITLARAFYENTLGLQVGNIYLEDCWVEYDLPGGGCFALTSVILDSEGNLLMLHQLNRKN